MRQRTLIIFAILVAIGTTACGDSPEQQAQKRKEAGMQDFANSFKRQDFPTPTPPQKEPGK